MNRVIIFSLAIFLLMISMSSCQYRKDDRANETIIRPDKFLSKETMINAMVDFGIAEASIRQMASKGEDTNKITPFYYKPVLEKYDITIEDYHANLTYYARDPEMMDELYKEVVNRLVILQATVRSQ